MKDGQAVGGNPPQCYKREQPQSQASSSPARRIHHEEHSDTFSPPGASKVREFVSCAILFVVDNGNWKVPNVHTIQDDRAVGTALRSAALHPFGNCTDIRAQARGLPHVVAADLLPP